MPKHLPSVFVCFVAAMMWVGPNLLPGQSETWQSSLTSHHAIATVNVNVQRASESFEGTDALEHISEFFELRRGLDLSLIHI